MKKTTIILLGLISSVFADTSYLKFNNQEIAVEKESEMGKTIFYNINIKEAVSNFKEFKSCLVESDLKQNLKKIYCVDNDLKTLYTELEGKITPDNKAFTFNLIYKMKDLSKEIEKYNR